MRNRLEWLSLIVLSTLLGAGWIYLSREDEASNQPIPLTTAPYVGNLAPDFTLQTIGGESVTLRDFTADGGRPVVLNFWATWCPPCVEELPMLNAFYRENASKGWQVVGLAIDQPSSVRKFLDRLPLDFPVGLAGLGGTELGRSLGNLTGGLPFTVVLGQGGRVLHRIMGQVTPDDLKQWVHLR